MKNLIKLVVNLIALCLIFLNSSFLNSQENNNNFTVVLDPGHGGKDPGNRGNGYYEKNIALSIALKVGSELEKQSNINVIYTRKKDVFVNLFKRAEIANKAKADLFISIHCDSHTSNAYGAGTFVLGLHANQRNFEIAKKENSVIFKEENYEQKYNGFDPNSPESVISLVLMQEDYLDQSIVIADLIQKAFVSDLKRKNRTVKQAGFIVLKYTYMPSVLVETGFLTNKKEGAYLNSKKGQTEMSKSIAKGILRYRKSISSDVIKNDSELFSDLDKNYTDKYFLKIQIASSSKKVPLKSYNFKGLGNLSYLKNNNTYRYYFERTQDYTLAKLMLKRAVKSGYKDALIVAFKNDKSITIEEYLSSYKK
ncbi:MAG: N-acetylmuramoyl-L-alanine amidase [Flavobacteriaceae bacterium]|nr:N-acetylmuramoyl-L-alanine amidase [Flavobacteriaceae bacterium]MDG1343573.1 N-acetylmuramoyl-L-alanine amidase [Flavobacteriaceae bacterium]